MTFDAQDTTLARARWNSRKNVLPINNNVLLLRVRSVFVGTGIASTREALEVTRDHVSWGRRDRAIVVSPLILFRFRPAARGEGVYRTAIERAGCRRGALTGTTGFVFNSFLLYPFLRFPGPRVQEEVRKNRFCTICPPPPCRHDNTRRALVTSALRNDQQCDQC